MVKKTLGVEKRGRGLRPSNLWRADITALHLMCSGSAVRKMGPSEPGTIVAKSAYL